MSIRLTGLRGWHRGTRHLTSFDGSAITRVRLTALGPGITPALVTTTSFTTDAGALPAIAAPSTISLTVPSGRNRVFILEGLDESGRVLAVMRTLATLTAGSRRLSINANTDAAARVLLSLMAGAQAGDAPDTAGIAASLTSSDLTSALLVYIDAITHYDSTHNTYSGGVTPLNFRTRFLADLMRTNGVEALSDSAPDDLHEAAGATFPLRVVANGTPVLNAEVSLLDPDHAAVQTDVDGLASFSGVPPGTWLLVIEIPGKIVTTTLVARDNETATLKTIDLTHAGTLTLPALSTPAEGDAFPAVGLLPWVETLVGGAKTAGRLSALDSRGSRPLGQVGVDATGATYVMSYGKVLRIDGADTVQVLARSATYGATTGIRGDALRTFTVARDGTVWVVDDERRLYRVALGEVPTEVGTLDILPDTLLFAPTGQLYARSAGRIDAINTKDAELTAMAAVDGDGPLAVDAAGNLYAWTGSKLVRLSSAGEVSMLGGALGGDEDGAAGRFGGVAGLAVAGSTLYVADDANNRVRRVDIATGEIGTLAGGVIGLTDGSFERSRFNRPLSLAYDAAQQALVVSDPGNRRVRRLALSTMQASTEFVLTEPDFLEGERNAARLGALTGLDVDAAGEVYAVDDTARVIWRVSADGEASRHAGTGQAILKGGVLPSLLAPIAGHSLAVGPRGEIMLAATPGRFVSAAGQTLSLTPLDSGTPRAVASDPEGRTFELTNTTTESRLYLRQGDDSWSLVAAGLPIGAKHLAASRNGLFYIATAAGITELDTSQPAPASRTVYAGEVQGLCANEDDGHLFATVLDDGGGGAVVDINPDTMAATTLAGTGAAGNADGEAASATFSAAIRSIAIDAAGRLYVADGDRIRRILRP